MQDLDGPFAGSEPSPHQGSRGRAARVPGYAAVAILAAVTAFHVYWALGGTWGAAIAWGSPDLPPATAVWVVVAMLIAAILVLLGRMDVWGRQLPGWIFRLGTWVIAVVFALAALGNFASGVSSTTYGREWHLFLFAPLLVALTVLSVVVARSRPYGNDDR